jgi:hypothetical protein
MVLDRRECAKEESGFLSEKVLRLLRADGLSPLADV